MRFLGLIIAAISVLWMATVLQDSKPQFFNWITYGTALWFLAWALWEGATMGFEAFKDE